MKDKNSKAHIEIHNDSASYILPLTALNLDAGYSQIALNIQTVNKPDSLKEKTVAPVIEFSLVGIKDGKETEIKLFSEYVVREIKLSETVNKNNAVAVRINDDGSFTSVPTLFEGDKAIVKSLTNSKYTVIERSKTFTDVDNGANWAEQFIEKLAAKGITTGKTDTTFAPDDYLTRAEFTVLLVRALGLPAETYNNKFSDVDGTEWFNQNGELMAAVKLGLIEGKQNGKFAPGEKITRAQAAIMISRALELDLLKVDSSKFDASKKYTDFKDAKTFGDWSKEGIQLGYQAGIFEGNGSGSFNPSGNLKRDQMAKALTKFLEFAGLM